MSNNASPAQIKLIGDMQTEGAPIPEHPQFDRPFDAGEMTAAEASQYIKDNIEYYNRLKTKARRKGALTEISKRSTPDAWGVPN